MNDQTTTRKDLRAMAERMGHATLFNPAVMRRERRTIQNCRHLTINNEVAGFVIFEARLVGATPDNRVRVLIEKEGFEWQQYLPVKTFYMFDPAYISKEQQIAYVLDMICDLARGKTSYDYDHGNMVKVRGKAQPVREVRLALRRAFMPPNIEDDFEMMEGIERNVNKLWEQLTAGYKT